MEVLQADGDAQERSKCPEENLEKVFFDDVTPKVLRKEVVSSFDGEQQRAQRKDDKDEMKPTLAKDVEVVGFEWGCFCVMVVFQIA